MLIFLELLLCIYYNYLFCKLHSLTYFDFIKAVKNIFNET